MAVKNEVDLIIRAKQYGTKSIKQLGGDLDKIANSQKKVSDSQKLAQSSARALAAEQEQLLAIMKTLDNRSKGLSSFKRQQEELTALEAKLREARARFAELTQQYFATEKPSKAFVAQLRAADGQVNALASQLKRAQGNLETTAARLTDAGLDATRFEQSQQEVNRALADAVRLYKQAEKNADRYGAAVAEAQQKSAAEAFRAQGQRALARTAGAAPTAAGAATAVSANAGAIDALVRPAKAAISSIDALEKEIKQLDAAIDTIPTSTSGSRESLEQLTDAAQRFRNVAKGLSAKGELIDDLRTQEARLASVRDEYNRTRTALEQYANAVMRADAPNEELAASLSRAQAAFTQSEAALRREQAAFDGLANKASRAGINVTNLAAEEQRLQAAAAATAQSQQRVAVAIDKTGAAVDRTDKRTKIFHNSQRTALSLFQRVRGQVLSLTASYVGLFGVMQGIGKSVDTVIANERILSRFSIGTGGDMEKAGEQMAYVRKKADELGLEFEGLADSYSRFFVASTQAGQSIESTQYIFEGFTEAAAALKLSAEDTAGVFKALEQIFSKGFIQAEELRGQLGDRLTGAFQLFAKAMGLTTKQLNDLLEKGGQVTSQMVLLGAQAAKGIFGEAARKNAAGLNGQMNILSNAMRDFRLAIMDGPFQKEFASLIQRATTFFKSKDGETFARNLGKLFASAAIGVGKLVEWFVRLQDKGSPLLRLLGGMAENLHLVAAAMAGIQIARFIGWLVQMRTALIAATAAQAALNTEMAVGTATSAARAGSAISALLSGPVAALLAIAATGIVISVVIRRQIETEDRSIKEDAEVASTKQQELLKRSINLRDKAAEEQRQYVHDVKDSTRAVNEEIAALEKRNEVLAKKKKSFVSTSTFGAGAAGAGGGQATGEAIYNANKAIDREAADNNARIQRLRKGRDDLIRIAKRTAEELPRVYKEQGKAAGDALAKELEAAAANAAKLVDAANATEDKKKKGREQDLADDRIRLAESVANKLRDIDKDMQTSQEDSLAARLKVVDIEIADKQAELDKLKAEAEKLGMQDLVKQIEEAGKKLETIRQQRAQKETKDFNAEQVAKNEQLINDKLQERSTALQAIQTLQEAGLITQSEAAQRIADTNASLLPQLDQLVIKAQAFINTLSGEPMARAQAALDGLKANIAAARVETNKAIKDASAYFANQFTDAFGETAKLIAEMIKGTEEGQDAFKKFGDIVMNTIADILIEIGKMILYQTIYNALKAAADNANSGGGGGIWGTILNFAAQYFSKQHTGGIAGRGTSGYKKVNPAVFAGAVRYHTGGIAGLAPDEVPTILKKNEEVLTDDDPRHRFNMGAGALGGAAVPQDVTIINQLDSGDVVSRGMATPAGKKAIFNVIKENPNAIRRLLQG